MTFHIVIFNIWIIIGLTLTLHSYALFSILKNAFKKEMKLGHFCQYNRLIIIIDNQENCRCFYNTIEKKIIYIILITMK